MTSFEAFIDSGMEPTPESLWWTSTYKAEEEMTLKVARKEKWREMCLCKYLIYWSSVSTGKMEGYSGD